MRVAIVALVFLAGEVFAIKLFGVVKRYLAPGSASFDMLSTIKGVLERLVLCTGLLAGFPHVLTVFSALKLGTRLVEDTRNQISNDYFLVGNLCSVGLALVVSIAIRAVLA